MSEETETIGRYTVERLIARGGMAEVLLARVQGPAGFAKQVVVKRILPEFAEDPRFVSLFLNEARIAAVLSHPNIAQVFDFGEHEGRYYLAMEYVDGVSIRQIIQFFRRCQETMPVGVAVKLVMGVCEGLQYAHEFSDESGEPLSILHRDISPDNLMVSVSGTPKIVDFGIAKVASAAEPVAVGLKGRFAYMPPELIRNGESAQQVDVYALGISLYEMVVGVRPFRADSDARLLQVIVEGNAQPAHEANPAVPRDLSEIIARAMHSVREERFPDCRAFHNALEGFLARSGEKVTGTDLAALAQSITKQRAAAEGRPRTRTLQIPVVLPSQPATATATQRATAPTPVPQQTPSQSTPATAFTPVPQQTPARGTPAPERATTHTRAPQQTPAPGAPAPERATTPTPVPQQTPARGTPATVAKAKTRHTAWVAAIIAGCVFVCGLAAIELLRPEPTPVMLEPMEGMAAGSADASIAKPDSEAPIAAVDSLADSGAPLAEASEPAADASQIDTAIAAGETKVDSELATADESEAKREAPELSAPVDPFALTELQPPRTEKPSARRARRGAKSTDPAEDGEGYLTLRSDPWSEVFVDGEKVGTTPLFRLPMSVGAHVVELQNAEGKGSKKLSVRIEPGMEERRAVRFD